MSMTGWFQIPRRVSLLSTVSSMYNLLVWTVVLQQCRRTTCSCCVHAYVYTCTSIGARECVSNCRRKTGARQKLLATFADSVPLPPLA